MVVQNMTGSAYASLDGEYTPSFILNLFEQHKSVKDEHQAVWKEISAISLPMAMRHIEQSGEDNRRPVDVKRRNIYNDTVADALDIMVAGFSTTMTPSESPWFTNAILVNGMILTMTNAGPRVRQLIDMRTDVLRAALYASPFYSIIPEVYKDGGLFGNAGLLMQESPNLKGDLDFEYVPLGTYIVMEDHKGNIIGFIRILHYTTQQMVKAFVKRPDGTEDWSKVSSHVKLNWECGNWYQLHTVFHSILPSKEKSHPYKSQYFEKGCLNETFLKEEKFSYFPFYFFRWSKRQGEPYAKDCPGMKTFHTNQMLQDLEKGCMIGYNQKADPTLKVSPDVEIGQFNRRKHGGVVVVNNPQETMAAPLFDINYPFGEIENKIQNKEMKIREGFYNNMFLAFLNSNKTEKTREEIIRKYEEKLAMVAPTVGRLKYDLLDRILADAAMIQERAGKMPSRDDIKMTIEQELQVQIEGEPSVVPIYTSLLMQAMRNIGTQNTNNFLGVVGALSQIKAQDGSLDLPWDWIDTDAFVLSKAEEYFIPAELLRDTELVKSIREGRAQMMAQAKQQEQLANLDPNVVQSLVSQGI